MEHWDGQMDLFDANPQREVTVARDLQASHQVILHNAFR